MVNSFKGEKTCGGSRISPRRGRQLPRGAANIQFAKFSRKLHEIERIWAPGGGGWSANENTRQHRLNWRLFCVRHKDPLKTLCPWLETRDNCVILHLQYFSLVSAPNNMWNVLLHGACFWRSWRFTLMFHRQIDPHDKVDSTLLFACYLASYTKQSVVAFYHWHYKSFFIRNNVRAAISQEFNTHSSAIFNFLFSH